MLMMIGFAVLSTSSLAVASFAWFTSNQKATASFTRLTVDAGLTFTFYAYKGNFENNDPTKAVTGYQTSALNNGFDQDFVEINNASWTTLDNMYPGDKLSFAIKVMGISASTISLDVDDFTAQRSETKFALIEETNINIEIAWAMRVFGDASPSGDYYTKFIAGEQYTSTVESPAALEDTFTKVYPFGEAIPRGESAEHKFRIIHTDRINDGVTYLFYTIAFSNEPETWFTLKANSETTYVQDDHGTSDCYQGLSFSIDDLKVKEGAAS